MYTFLEETRPFAAQPRPQCAAIEVDIAGLSGMSMLEWLGEPARECAVVADRATH